MKALLCFFQAFLFLVSAISGMNSNIKRQADENAMKLTSITDFSFDKITAEEMEVSQEEKLLCREWYEKNILFAGQNGTVPAYDVTVGCRRLSLNLSDWNFETGPESEPGAVHKGGKTTIITVSSMRNGIVITVEATIYEENATCEWTVYAKNTSEEKSPVISNFCGAKMTLDAQNPTLYVSKGSPSEINDFELYKTDINTLKMNFSATGGRNTSFMPYFNISGENGGFIVGVGWTGQWLTTIQKKSEGVELIAKQQEFRAYLLPGEIVRTPLVSVTFFGGDNAVKGFNTLRNWEMDCVYPDSVTVSNGYVIANEFSTKTTDDFISHLGSIDPDILKDIDYYWMDAGWYRYNEAWHDGVGNWIADASRFPDTLKPVSDVISQQGKKFLLWFEPERVRENTALYNEAVKHTGWIVEDGDDLLWNMADDEACEYLTQYICNAMLTNGVTAYRQDFNFDPLSYWEKADKKFYDRRTGICENHYVTNLYKYLDALLASVDGLFIDNCASGGRRLDIEMTRRSVPLWRSDYNCGNADGSLRDSVLEATQAMTYSLSFWQPYSGTNRYFHSEYASRTGILTHQSVYEPDKTEFAKYSQISGYMTLNYYPIVYGGTDMTKYLAMQFGSGEEGAAVIYKREQVEDSTFVLSLNGLHPDVLYTVYNFDNPDEKYTLRGSELMEKGITLTINETPKAAIYFYSVE